MNFLFYAFLITGSAYILSYWGTRQLFKARLYQLAKHLRLGYAFFTLLSFVVIVPPYLYEVLSFTHIDFNVWMISIPPTICTILLTEWLYHRKLRQIHVFFKSIRKQKKDEKPHNGEQKGNGANDEPNRL